MSLTVAVWFTSVLLLQVGGPAELNVIIDGEALLNDGSAYVMYSLFIGLAEGQALSIGGFAASAVKGALAAPLVRPANFRHVRRRHGSTE